MAGSKTILSIEDDHLISEMYARTLRKAGYVVDEINNGADGITAARAKSYDLILLDIFIPEKTGIDVVHELRGEDGTGLPATKILIMTNYAQDDDDRDLLESKVDDYVIKADITPKMLLERVNNLLAT